MPESQAKWTVKTLAYIIVIAIVVSLITTGIQMLVWGRSNGAVSGGAAAAVAVAFMMSRRKKLQETTTTPTKT
jgi:hypothetical protein